MLKDVMRPAAVTVVGCAIAAALWVAPVANADGCPNAAIRAQQDAGHLPGCRAWEKVSPSDKASADVGYGGSSIAADGGDAFQYDSSGAFVGAAGAARANPYLATRGATGWSTRNLTPYQQVQELAVAFPVSKILAFSPDLSVGALINAADPDDPHAPAGSREIYRRSADGAYTRVSPEPPSDPGLGSPQFVGASEDFRHILFQSSFALTLDAPAVASSNLYEWHDGQVRLVASAAIAPDGTSVPDEATVAASQRITSYRVISPDGSQVVFVAGTPAQLWLAQDGAAPRLVSASRRTGSSGDPAPAGAKFLGTASEGGKLSKVYFTSADALTNDATVGNSGKGRDLYAYDVATGKLDDLVIDPSHPDGARVVRQSFRASVDGTRFYFNATDVLAPGAVASGADANGEDTTNTYLWDRGTVRYVGPLGTLLRTNTEYSSQMRISPNGRYLVAHTNLRLTSEDNRGLDQFYLYDAVSGGWTCVSCRHDGRPTTASATSRGATIGYTVGFFVPRIVTDNGRVLFETAEPLAPEDTNGATDVYLWEDGAARLLSSGRDPHGAHAMELSANGDDVFIGTRERLVPDDRDSNVDVYDVRVGGGFAATAASPVCVADDCQGTATGSPPLLGAASASLSAEGNEQARTIRPLGPLSAMLRGPIRGTTARIAVRLPARGRLTVSGVRLKPVRKTVRAAGTVVVGTSLTPAGRAVLRRGRVLSIAARVRFVPASGRTSSVTVRLRFRAPQRASVSGRQHVRATATTGGRA